MKLTIRKTLFISLGLLAVLVLAALAVSFFRVNRTLTVTGAFEYRTVRPVVAREGGFVAGIPAAPDTRVVTGDPLLILRSEDLDAEIETLEHQLELARLELDALESQGRFESFQARLSAAGMEERVGVSAAREELQRRQYLLNRELYGEGRISRNQLDEVELAHRSLLTDLSDLRSGLDVARARMTEIASSYARQIEMKRRVIQTSAARLERLERRKEDLTIRAAGPGVFLLENPDRLLGTYLTKGSRAGEIVSFDDIDFIGYAGNSDIIRIKAGQKVYFDVDVFRRKVFIRGTVSKIGYKAVSGPAGESLFPVRIEVDNKSFLDRGNELFIQAGVRGEALIVVEEGLSLITMVWEKILDFIDFEVYLE